MRDRDKQILAALERFKCLTRDQIAQMFFNHTKKPHTNANFVLKRLRRDGYITARTDRVFQQYVYFPNPPEIKKNSQKVDHYLLIAQIYIDMMKYDTVKQYDIEPIVDDFIPDAFARWKGSRWFIEAQNSLYTTKQLEQKLQKYLAWYESGEWRYTQFVNDMKPIFPHVLIVGKVNKKLDTSEYPFRVAQVESIDAFMKMIQKQIQVNGVRMRE
ncbi:replication-relaxation family protein [Anoxybacillus sp. ST4]|nr:replication-relaxation family protein [Anoxybacillus sp. ST4]MBW7649779.1 replication-relaxation family protein [Anoxybacillus sp. ST4]